MCLTEVWYDKGMNDEVSTFEEREYISPTLSRDEQLSFIENLRQVQAQNQQQVNDETHALGTDVTSNLGGLTGAQGLWADQYVNPQVQSMTANLTKVAQADAAKAAMQNLSNMWSNRYNQAKRAYNRRANTASPANTTQGDVSYDTDKVDILTQKAGQAPAGWAYISVAGRDRWYKTNADGTIDYSNYVETRPNTATQTQYYNPLYYPAYQGEDGKLTYAPKAPTVVKTGGGTFKVSNGKATEVNK